MTDFIAFARAHGILIDHLPPIGVWRRYPTEDHQRKRNGAVKFMGTHGFVQNWAMNTEVEVWRGDASASVDMNKIRRNAQQAERRRIEQQEAAAKKAGWIMHQCQTGHHPYLEAKGFKDEQGNVWKTGGGLVLVIPMRVGHRLVGCQFIREDGEKKFLFGQRTSEASFVFDNKGPHILCEGYATGLSIRAAMKALKRRYTLHICFSAGNMVKVAATLPRGFVVADNDESKAGEDAAKRIGWPYWMPPEVGMDANDLHRRDGLFKFSQSLNKAML